MIFIAKQNLKMAFSNAVLTVEDQEFMIEEFDSKGETKGKWNLSQLLLGMVNQEGFKLSYDVTNELESEF